MLTGKLDYAKVGLPTQNEKEPTSNIVSAAYLRRTAAAADQLFDHLFLEFNAHLLQSKQNLKLNLG